MTTYSELISYLKGKGYDFKIEVEDVGPTDEFTLEEQEEQCCGPVDTDECADDGKVEPWSGWDDSLTEELNYPPEPTPNQLLQRAEDAVGAGNVHLKVQIVGPPGNCGEKITEWTDRLGCCEDPTELLKLSGTTGVQRDQDYTFKINSGSGELPVSWGTLGSWIELAPRGNEADVHINECFCNPGVVYAQDTCESVAPWVLSLSDGTWSSVADEELSSPFGWFQDGSSSSFFATGFSDDFTKVSTQHYWEVNNVVGTEEVVCGTDYAGKNDNPIVTPQDSQGFTKCESSSVWIRLKEGFENLYDVRYALDSQSTSEFTHPCQDSSLESGVAEGVIPTIGDNDYLVLSWSGGDPPFELSLHGVEVYFNRDDETVQVHSHNSRSVWIWSKDSCGWCWLTVTDSCGSSIEIGFRADTGEWSHVYQNGTGGIFGTIIDGVVTKAPYEGGCPATISVGHTFGFTYFENMDAGSHRITVSVTNCGGDSGFRLCSNYGGDCEAAFAAAMGDCNYWFARSPDDTCSANNEAAIIPGATCLYTSYIPGDACTEVDDVTYLSKGPASAGFGGTVYMGETVASWGYAHTQAYTIGITEWVC